MTDAKAERERIEELLRERGLDPEARSDLIDSYLLDDNTSRALHASGTASLRERDRAITQKRQSWKMLFATGKPEEGSPRQTELEKRQHAAGLAYTEALCSEAGQAWMVFFRDLKIYKKDRPEYAQMLALHREPTPFIDVFPNWQEFILGGPCNPHGFGPEDEDGKPKYWS
jgi:hypothetical protein